MKYELGRIIIETTYYCKPIAGLKTAVNLLQDYLTNM